MSHREEHPELTGHTVALLFAGRGENMPQAYSHALSQWQRTTAGALQAGLETVLPEAQIEVKHPSNARELDRRLHGDKPDEYFEAEVIVPVARVKEVFGDIITNIEGSLANVVPGKPTMTGGSVRTTISGNAEELRKALNKVMPDGKWVSELASVPDIANYRGARSR